jgi:hypothetical protein
VDARLIVFAAAVAALPAQAFDHGAWNALVQKHVVLLPGKHASQLDYAGMARERAVLKVYLESLSRVPKAEFDGWP